MSAEVFDNQPRRSGKQCLPSTAATTGCYHTDFPQGDDDIADANMENASTAPANPPLRRKGIRHYLSYLRSLLFTNLLIYTYTAVCGALSLLGSLFDRRGRWQHGCARAWSW